MNPIFIEFYAHENCDCYKVENPWTIYGKEKIVLCRVDEGFDKAKELCETSLRKCMSTALVEPISNR